MPSIGWIGVGIGVGWSAFLAGLGLFTAILYGVAAVASTHER